ncbi:MAG: nucleoside diphosphate kinase [actinobacterium acAMD-5]|jgi:nucleoside-diphosphate kinase|nr:MAG: nucleoside diphosphate kinase [actinobacterium acAMD-5]
MQRTLVLIKPDGVQRGLIGEVLARIEAKNWKIVAMELRQLDVATAQTHYAEHKDKPFFSSLVEFITSAPLVAAVVEGPEVIVSWRTLMGATNPVNATPGTIRGDLAAETQLNVTHGSDSEESAKREIGLFFPNLKN